VTELTKNKIAFAVGLLAVLFTLTPLLSDLGGVGFSFLELHLSVRGLYWFLSSTLGLSAYCYGFQFILPNRRFPTVLGDIFYVTGLVAPLLFLGLFLIALLIDILAPLLRNDRVLSVLQFVMGVATGVASAFAAYRARQTLDLRQRQAERSTSSSQEAAFLLKATALHKDGHFDLAVIEAFRALEVAARAQYGVIGSGRQRSEWFGRVLNDLPSALRSPLERVRAVRNNAAHAVEPISDADAQEALRVIGKAVALLANIDPNQCPSCGSTPMLEEAGVDSGFHWTRKRCEKCGYLDLS
jgi:hypothetical protein